MLGNLRQRKKSGVHGCGVRKDFGDSRVQHDYVGFLSQPLDILSADQRTEIGPLILRTKFIRSTSLRLLQRSFEVAAESSTGLP